MSGTVLIAGGGTGGHLMPALALAQALPAARPGLTPLVVGAERGVEARLLPTRDVPYELLASEPIYRRQWWRNVRWLWLAPRLRRQVDQLLDHHRPAVVVGTGGYASAPVVWRAAARGIPTAILEQDAYPGLATRLLAPRVDHLYLGAPEARERLRPGRATQVFVTGSPIVPPDPARAAAARTRFGLTDDRPVVLITGGSQGAAALNREVAAWLQRGRLPATVLWLTGRHSYGEYAALHRPPAVQVIDFLDPMADGYAVADLVVSRAGMMTLAELCAWGLPSILIPLPSAAADHQTWNARALAGAGAAELLPQSQLTADRLAERVEALLADAGRLAAMGAAARGRGRPGSAAAIVSHILTLLG